MKRRCFFLGTALFFVFAAVNAWAGGGSNAKGSVNTDQFSSSAYWTALEYYEKRLNTSTSLDELNMRFTAFRAAYNLTNMMFPEGVQWLDSATFKKRSKQIIESAEPGDLPKDREGPPTKPLVIKILTNPRPLTNLDDLRVDSASMQGKTVKVQGKGIFLMNQFLLKRDMKDMSPVLVNIEAVDRDGRKAILQKCGDIMKPCTVTIYGKVGDDSPQVEIIAKSVEWW